MINSLRYTYGCHLSCSLNLFTVHRIDAVRVVQSTGAAQPQAGLIYVVVDLFM